MIESGQASNIVLATSDTYTKFINPSDRTVRTIFGDGATATWISDKGNPNSVGNVLVGTDGSGAGHLVVPTGGLRSGDDINPKSAVSERGLEASGFDLFMDGREIFNFTLRISDGFLQRLLDQNDLKIEDVDHFVFHQANAFMLNHLTEKLGLPKNKVPILMSDFGNTVSGTIPMVLDKMINSGKIIPGQKLVLFGFGVGLSWAGVVIET
jgi:3-oxoacyl-[acyl-carrier-protein] synthase-3